MNNNGAKTTNMSGKVLFSALSAIGAFLLFLSAGCGASQAAISSTSIPIPRPITDWRGKSISYEDAKGVLAEAIRRLVMEDRAYLKESERCVALGPLWRLTGHKEERIPVILLDDLLADLHGLPMPVYQAADWQDANSRCERDVAQFVRITEINLREVNDDRVFVRVREKIGGGSSGIEYTLERHDGAWVIVSAKGYGGRG